MKIAELLQEETADEYLKRLVKTLGIKKLGKGRYASVFQHPVYQNVAVKVFDSSHDSEYLKFVEFCLANQLNPWLPKIIGTETATVDSKYVRTDRMAHFPKPTVSIVFFQKLRKAKFPEIKKATQVFLDSVPEKYFLDEKETYQAFEDFGSEVWELLGKHAADPHIAQVSKFFFKIGANDVHENNVMMRDEGGRSQLVFTDPVAS